VTCATHGPRRCRAHPFDLVSAVPFPGSRPQAPPLRGSAFQRGSHSRPARSPLRKDQSAGSAFWAPFSPFPRAYGGRSPQICPTREKHFLPALLWAGSQHKPGGGGWTPAKVHAAPLSFRTGIFLPTSCHFPFSRSFFHPSAVVRDSGGLPFPSEPLQHQVRRLPTFFFFRFFPLAVRSEGDRHSAGRRMQASCPGGGPAAKGHLFSPLPFGWSGAQKRDLGPGKKSLPGWRWSGNPPLSSRRFSDDGGWRGGIVLSPA